MRNRIFLLVLVSGSAFGGCARQDARGHDAELGVARKALTEQLQRDGWDPVRLEDLADWDPKRFGAKRALILSADELEKVRNDRKLAARLNDTFRFSLENHPPVDVSPREVESKWEVAARARRAEDLPICKERRVFIVGEADFSKIPEKNATPEEYSENRVCVKHFQVKRGRMDGERQAGLVDIPFIMVSYDAVLRLSGSGYLFRMDVVLDASGQVVLILSDRGKMLWIS